MVAIRTAQLLLELRCCVVLRMKSLFSSENFLLRHVRALLSWVLTALELSNYV